jgi:uncharacterized protein with HEPN domain
MLPQVKNDLLYLLNILESIEKINMYVKDIDDAEKFYYANDQLNFNATLNLFANIGDNVGKVSEELKIKNSHIKWQDIKDFRNKIVHDYIGIDLFIVFRIIKNDLPPLKEKIIKIVSAELENRNFDEKEFQEARKSFYYRHIPFEKIEYENPPEER